MSGPRPQHLSRRGAVYVVRFTLPRDMPSALSGMEIRKSLNTKSIDEARAKCLKAELWFQRLLSRLRMMNNPTRKHVELAASLFFNRLVGIVDSPRDFLPENIDDEISFNIGESRRRISEIDEQLVLNKFDWMIEDNTRELLSEVQLKLGQLDSNLAMLALQLAAKAEREQMRYLIHQLSEPEKSFVVDDDIFLAPAGAVTVPASAKNPVNSSHSTLSLGELIELHAAALEDQGNGESNLTEFRRISGWLVEEIGGTSQISTIQTPQLREFRDKLKRRSKIRQGVSGPLSAHLTNDREGQILSSTARRYWGYIQSMFRAAVSEGHLTTDPAASLQVNIRKDEETEAKEPFSTEEVYKYFSTPLFAGYQSKTRRFETGACMVRDGHWWSGVIPAFTGMRASEVAQLLPTDFIFEADIPHILVRPEDESGAKTKTTKTKSSNRAVPIATEMLELGLREFVKRQSALFPKERIFRVFPLGTGGKKSAGMSKFWIRYFQEFGLHKPGRGTHIWRHTVIYRLRAVGVAEEDIRYLVGHASGSQTSAYGSGPVLERVQENCLKRLDYGFNVVETLGGPYNAKQHEV